MVQACPMYVAASELELVLYCQKLLLLIEYSWPHCTNARVQVRDETSVSITIEALVDFAAARATVMPVDASVLGLNQGSFNYIA